jgi:uncharacterized membrane protein YbhN (UPF0104 family)
MTPTARRVVIALLAGIAVFAAFSIHADVRAVWQSLSHFSWWALAGALGLASVNYAVRFVRWQLYLHHIGVAIPRTSSALVFLSGFALSVTPGKVGELLKSYLLREAHQVPVARSAPVVVAERISDLAALLALGVAGAAAYGVGGGTMLAGGAALLFGLTVMSRPALAAAAIRALTAPRRLGRFREPLATFHRGIADLVRPRPLAWATGLGVIAWLAECVGFAAICTAFPGVEVPLGLAVFIYASTTVAGALSFLPGGLLVTEAAMTVLLVRSSAGMDEATAVAATLLIRLATLWFAVAIGLVALAALGRSRREPPRDAPGPESG